MRELSLFSGAGGGLLGTKLLGWEAVGYVERDPYCQAVLEARIRDGLLDPGPIFGDIRAFLRSGDCDRFAGRVDVVTAGFPCQPFSTASRGRRVAEDLWPETLDAILRVRPGFVLLENVQRWPIDRARDELRDAGFESPEPARLDPFDLGAGHHRPRWWLLAHAHREGERPGPVDEEVARLRPAAPLRWWQETPGDVLGVDAGLASRMDRLRALGNSQVPSVVALAWRTLMERSLQHRGTPVAPRIEQGN